MWVRYTQFLSDKVKVRSISLLWRLMDMFIIVMGIVVTSVIAIIIGTEVSVEL